jgi:hypothetical protein
MIGQIEYLELINLFYSFIETEFGFTKVNETIKGNAFYDVEYRDSNRMISISYENIEDHLEVIIFILLNGKMPDYDDKARTLHIRQLNKLVMPKVSKMEINSNAEYFSNYSPKSEIERKLLKEAKALRLALKHFNDL